MNRIIVDRIENEIAICEIEGIIKNIPLSEIYSDIREGDVLCVNNGGKYVIDKTETEKRRENIQSRFEALKKKNS